MYVKFVNKNGILIVIKAAYIALVHDDGYIEFTPDYPGMPKNTYVGTMVAQDLQEQLLAIGR